MDPTTTSQRDGLTELPVNVYGNFRGTTTSSLEIIHDSPYLTFEYFQPKYSFVKSMETM